MGGTDEEIPGHMISEDGDRGAFHYEVFLSVWFMSV